MKLATILFILPLCVACGGAAESSQPLDLDDLRSSKQKIFSRMARVTPDCVAICEQIAAKHDALTQTPEWRTLAASDAWQQHLGDKRALKACKQGADDCSAAQTDFESSWSEVEACEAFADANALPEARELEALFEKADAFQCWEDPV